MNDHTDFISKVDRVAGQKGRQHTTFLPARTDIQTHIPTNQPPTKERD